MLRLPDDKQTWAFGLLGLLMASHLTFLGFGAKHCVGPRYIDGVNIDADVAASFPSKEQERAIEEPVTGLDGLGYEPGQKNLDGSDL